MAPATVESRLYPDGRCEAGQEVRFVIQAQPLIDLSTLFTPPFSVR
jgi:hypothetical protein